MKHLIILALVLFFSSQIFAQSTYVKVSTSSGGGGVNYEQTIRSMLQMYEKNPKSYYSNIRLGYLYYSIKKYANAEHHYQAAATIRSTSVEPLLGLYLVYASQKKYEKGEGFLKKVIKIDPNNYYGNYYLTYCLMYQMEYSSAKKVAIQMLRIYPSDTNFLYALKNCYIGLKKGRDAQKIQDCINLLNKK